MNWLVVNRLRNSSKIYWLMDWLGLYGRGQRYIDWLIG